MQRASAVFGCQPVLRLAHVEEQFAIFAHEGACMLGEKFFQRCCDPFYGLIGRSAPRKLLLAA
jgi:hypothetical protein